MRVDTHYISNELRDFVARRYIAGIATDALRSEIDDITSLAALNILNTLYSPLFSDRSATRFCRLDFIAFAGPVRYSVKIDIHIFFM